MPIFITQGRYTREAVKGMIIKPEDRADAVSRLFAKGGGRLLSYYVIFGDYDFLLAAASSGGVTGLRTSLAISSIEAKGAFAAAGDLAPGFRSAGGAS
jgi:uncharacterized protein with GYD domain